MNWKSHHYELLILSRLSNRFAVISIKFPPGFRLYVFLEHDSNSCTEEQRPETEAHTYGPLIYDHDDKSKQRERERFSANGAGTTKSPCKDKKKKENGPTPTALSIQKSIPGGLQT